MSKSKKLCRILLYVASFSLLFFCWVLLFTSGFVPYISDLPDEDKTIVVRGIVLLYICLSGFSSLFEDIWQFICRIRKK